MYIATDGVSSEPTELKFCQKVCFRLLHNPHVGHLSASSRFLYYMLRTVINISRNLYIATDGVKSGPMELFFFENVCFTSIHSPLLWLLSASSRSLRYMLITAQILYRFSELGHSMGTMNWRKVIFGTVVYNMNIQVCAKFQLSRACVA